jgi:MoaA/NifB/PqqE/SkfB family radical SAM enzyme
MDFLPAFFPSVVRSWQRAQRASRYLRPVVQHGSVSKLANIALVEAEMRMRKVRMRGLPYYYIIDICNVCNLRCPLCPTGNGRLDRKQDFISTDEYRRILDRVKDYALVVSIYNHGEPFLNPDVFDIIALTSQQNIACNASSNLNWPRPVDVKDIVRSGLGYLTVSLDGVSQDVYSQYRVRGNVAEVFSNLRELLAVRKALRSKTPYVEWQYIVFKHNEHEMQRARELAAEIGVDLLRFISPGVPPEDMHDKSLQDKWMPENPIYHGRHPKLSEKRGYVFDQACFYLYRSMFIYTGGGVTPCCFAHDEKHDFANIFDQSVQEIWNNESYQSARMLFSKHPPEQPRKKVLCDTCALFRQDGAKACGVRPAFKLMLEQGEALQRQQVSVPIDGPQRS